MNDTPRTDAIWARRNEPNHCTMSALLEHARQLERELRRLAADYADLQVFGRVTVDRHKPESRHGK